MPRSRHVGSQDTRLLLTEVVAALLIFKLQLLPSAGEFLTSPALGLKKSPLALRERERAVADDVRQRLTYAVSSH